MKHLEWLTSECKIEKGMNENREPIRSSVNWGGRSKPLPVLMTLALLLSLVGPLVAPLTPQSARVQPLLLEMAAQNPDQTVSVIVQKTVKGDRVEQALAALGGHITKDLHIINGFAAEMKARDVTQLAKADSVRWVSLDAPVNSTSTLMAGDNIVLRENFNNNEAESASWRSDPTWSGEAWTEIGEGDGAKLGDVAVTDFSGGSRTGLRLQNANKGLQGSAKLSGAHTATLSFGYRRKNLDDAADYVSVQITNNNGAAWTELVQIAGPGSDDDLQIVSFDISAYATDAMAIRFLSSASLGDMNKVYIDFVKIEHQKNGAAPKALSLMTNGDLMANGDLITGGGFTVRDEFNVTAYSNNDGAVMWLGDWIETGDDGSATSGDITIEAESCPNGGRCLELDARSGHAISRAVDLSGAASATFSFAYKWNGGTGGAVAAEASSDGVTWTVLRTYASNASGAEQFDLTPYLSTNTHIRFRVAVPGELNHFWVDDVQIESAGSTQSNTGVSGIVRDDFNAVSYSNNNGTRTWSNSWAETGDYDSSPKAGNVKISSGALQLKYKNQTLHRAANLAGATVATLSFKYKRSALDTTSDYVAIQVSANNGVTWIELSRFAGPGNDSKYQTASYDISAYAAANTAIRFVTSSSLGSSDSVYFDDIQIEHSCVECIDPSLLINNYVKAIGADRLWNGSPKLQGKHVTVAVVDSGVAKHDDLKNKEHVTALRLLSRAEFGGDQTGIDDKNGHGSHIAGIIAGDGSQSNGAYVGVAPKADLVDVKVADDQGMSTLSDVVVGLQWILEHKDVYPIRVVNLSLNSTVAESYHTNPLNAAVEILWFNGIVVVVAAGNNGTATLYPPANDPFVIVVGATDDQGTDNINDDVVASFSAYGTTPDGVTKPDLVAPGRNIVSLLASDDSNFALNHPANIIAGPYGLKYFKMSGTSAAAPMVTGAAALLLQDEPNLNPDQVKYRLTATANKAWPGYNAATAGAGYLDVYAAVTGTTTESANTGITASQLLWTGSNPVNWGSVQWGSVQWGSVQWGSVQWGSDYWGP
jgi:serine protease AprX